MSNKTIIYYTGNIESESFENKIIENLVGASNGLPIISVSQKPLDLGENICVGDVGHSYLNAFKQILIGCRQAKTEYVAMAESDCLYPKTGYFDFEPSDTGKIYSYNNNWIIKPSWQRFYRKEQTHGGMIYGRKFLINLLEKSLLGLPMWSRKKIGFPFYEDGQRFEWFGGNPIINVITGANGRKGTSLMQERKTNLPYWGECENVKRKLWIM